MRRSDFIWSIIVLTTVTTIAFANAYRSEDKNHSVENLQLPTETSRKPNFAPISSGLSTGASHPDSREQINYRDLGT